MTLFWFSWFIWRLKKKRKNKTVYYWITDTTFPSQLCSEWQDGPMFSRALVKLIIIKDWRTHEQKVQKWKSILAWILLQLKCWKSEMEFSIEFDLANIRDTSAFCTKSKNTWERNFTSAFFFIINLTSKRLQLGEKL